MLPLISTNAERLARTGHARVTYRADIDGLRAIAVLLVVFDHLHTRIRGGHIGVDVFFVISGYLISGNILREMDAGSFSIARFYERRVRRILPALLVMLVGTSVLTLRFFVPSEIEDFGRSMLSALFSVSNLLFRHQAGYFDVPSTFKPLLHTWSLGVEEQFYIFFPLLLVGIRRWLPNKVRLAIWSLTGISFASACLWVHRDPTGAFFLAPLRAWELLLGTLASQRYLVQGMNAVQRNCAALGGIILILIPALCYTVRTPFPGLMALPPCLGALLIIMAGDAGPSGVGAVLATRPFVSVGLISYSLYLWHWPIITFQKIGYLLVEAPPDSKRVKIAVFLAAIAMAILSWRFVEKPFREGRWRSRSNVLFLETGIVFTALLIAGTVMVVSRGLPRRFPEDALAVDAYTQYAPAVDFRQHVCFLDTEDTFEAFNKKDCLAPDLTSNMVRPQYLLLGDSHAAHLYQGLAKVFPELDVSQATAASCRPFVSQMRATGTCASLMRYMFGDFLLTSHPAAVLLAGHWDKDELGELGETVKWLQQHRQNVIIYGPIMEFTEPLPRLLAMALRDHDPGAVERHRDGAGKSLDRQMAALAKDSWHVGYISAFQDLCGTKADTVSRSQLESPPNCPLYAAPGIPLLFDTDHFTPEGSILFAKAIKNNRQLP